MELAISIILVLIVCLAGVVLVVLIMPLSFRSQGSLTGFEASGWIHVGWAFGALQVRAQPDKGVRLYVLGVPVHRFDVRNRAKTQKSATKKKKKSKPKTATQVRSLWHERSTLSWAAKRMLSTLHLTGQLRGRLGLGDPADTAWLAVLFMQFESRFQRFRWAVQLDYTDEVIDLNGRIGAWLVPGQFLLVGLALFLRRDVRMALKT